MTFQHIHASQFDALKGRMDAAYDYAVKSQTHLWVATIAHRVSDQAMANLATEPLQLDFESMLMTPALGCYVCEQPFERRLLKRRCPGEPT